MQTIINDEKYGKIEYTENTWSGSKKLSINGVPLEKKSRSDFVYQTENGAVMVKISGNTLIGATVTIGDDKIQVTPKLQWYEFIFPVLMFALTIIWGNSPALVAIIPIVGGAIGGVVSAVCAFTCFYLAKMVKPVCLKLLIGLGFFVLDFVVCFGIAKLILATML